MSKKKVLIIGGGAAGFFAAANIDAQFYEITILEKTSKTLSKVAISGGGRCNVTNGNFPAVPDFARNYPRGNKFLKKSLHHFNFQDTIDWFAHHGVTLKKEKDGRMFPVTDNAKTIIDCLEKVCNTKGVNIILKTSVVKISPSSNKFDIITNNGTFTADKVIIACGGFAKIEQWQWLANLQLKIEPPVPSLFTFNIPRHPITHLMGLSVPNAQVRIHNSKFAHTGPLLITHWGLSGPAVLRLSAVAARYLAALEYQFSISVNWLGDFTENEIRSLLHDIQLQHPQKSIFKKNEIEIPSRLWELLIEYSGLDTQMRWNELNQKNLNLLVNLLYNSELTVKGKTTFKEEFVTAGGVALSEINYQSFECKNISGLYIIGEVLDIDGVTGGFNFQNAWTGAYLAAQSINALK